MTAPSQTSSVPTPSDDNQPEQIPPDRILFAEIRQRGFLRLDNPLVSPLRKALAEAGCKIKTAMLADACSTPEVLAVLARGEASGEDTLTVDADDTGIADDLDRTTLVNALGTALSNAGRNVDPPILATAIAKVLVDRDGPKQNPDKTRHDRKGGSFSAELEAIGAPHFGRVLAFDTETTLNVHNQCRFGIYELHGLDLLELQELDRQIVGRTLLAADKLRVRAQLDKLQEAGVFFNPRCTSPAEQQTIRNYAAAKRLRCMTLDEFVDTVLTEVVKNKISPREKAKLRADRKRPKALIVGHNLPFDLGAICRRFGFPRAKNPMEKAGLNYANGFWMQLCSCGIDGEYGNHKHAVEHNDCGYHPFIKVKKLGSAKHKMIARTGVHIDKAGTRKTFPNNSAFLDTMTLGKVMVEGSGSLKELARILDTESRKSDHDILHDGPITPEDVEYCEGDVTTTWQVFQKLRDLYKRHDLAKPMQSIFSAASLGKAYLEKMNIPPFAKQHADFMSRPAELVAPCMASYFGARSEVRYRCKPAEVITLDFKSQYSAINSLLELQAVHIAHHLDIDRSIKRAEVLLDAITIDDLRRKDTWLKFCGFVKLKPNKDILPVRTNYSDTDDSSNIGDNPITSDAPLWYALPDVIASIIRTKRVPKILDTIFIDPVVMVSGLTSVDFYSDPRFRIDPATQDIFTSVIDFRDMVKVERDTRKAELMRMHSCTKEQLKTDWYTAYRFREICQKDQQYAFHDSLQVALKVFASAASYGITCEINADTYKTKYPGTFYTADSTKRVLSNYVEEPGEYFAPPIAPLITAGSRLLLAIAEQLGLDRGMSHMLCDTDSMAYMRPDAMTRDTFVANVHGISDWFQPLSSYKTGKLFPIEHDSDSGLPLRGVAISAKRYVLYRITPHAGRTAREHVQIVKGTQHGLGHIYIELSQYQPLIPDTPPGKLTPWQRDLWLEAAVAFENGVTNPRITLPGLDLPLRTQQTVATATLMSIMAPRFVPGGAEGLSESEIIDRTSIRPFSFWIDYGKLPDDEIDRMNNLTAEEKRALAKTSLYGCWHKNMTVKEEAASIRRYDTNQPLHTTKTLVHDYNGDTRPAKLKTVNNALTNHFTHPESKSYPPYGIGTLTRRHVFAVSIASIGKESDRITEFDDEARHLAATSPDIFPITEAPILADFSNVTVAMQNAVKTHGIAKLASVCGISMKSARNAMNRTPSTPNLAKIKTGLTNLYADMSGTQPNTPFADQIVAHIRRFGFNEILDASLINDDVLTETDLTNLANGKTNTFAYGERGFDKTTSLYHQAISRLKAKEAAKLPPHDTSLASARTRAAKFSKHDLAKAAGSNGDDDSILKAVNTFLAGGRTTARMLKTTILPAIESCEAAARDWPKYKVIHVITSTDEHGNMYHHPLIGPPELITYTDAEIEAMRQDERDIKNYLRRLARRQRKPTKHAA